MISTRQTWYNQRSETNRKHSTKAHRRQRVRKSSGNSNSTVVTMSAFVTKKTRTGRSFTKLGATSTGQGDLEFSANERSDAVVVGPMGAIAYERGEFKAREFGVSMSRGGESLRLHFLLEAPNARRVVLCLFFTNNEPENANDYAMSKEPTVEIEMERGMKSSDDDGLWSVAITKGVPLKNVRYGYRVFGENTRENRQRFDEKVVLMDPYAKYVSCGRRRFGDLHVNEREEERVNPADMLGAFDFSEKEEDEFDWEGVEKPQIAEEDLVIYEMTVRAFTKDDETIEDEGVRGSFLGVAEKVKYLKDLGVNAIELLPIFEFDEMEFKRFPNDSDERYRARAHMVNTWGYSTMSFFAPMSRYASNGGDGVAASKEFKHMVKTLHKAGIEVILDVVYNHTGESTDDRPNTCSFRGIDNANYYMMDENNNYMNYTGCGNTVNANNPMAKEFILASLRHWVTEYKIDGFRFDLASCLTRDQNGEPMRSPPLIRAIAKDEILSKVKLIAEPWDAAGLYQVGDFPNWDVWGEWNGKYRDNCRRFIKGADNQKKQFADSLLGSSRLYRMNNRKPFHSINFITAHDGFTLNDAVSYQQKHNDDNGENGNDGANDNESWNCGYEGETGDQNVNNLRARQMKNFLTALFVSQGTPMLLMGDEYGHTRFGNNNTYGHDDRRNNFQWFEMEKYRETRFRFCSSMIKFRKANPLLGRREWLDDSKVIWHEDNWDNEESKFIAFTLVDDITGKDEDLYIAFNAHEYMVEAKLPKIHDGGSWFRIVDTNLCSPDDFDFRGSQRIGSEGVYNIAEWGAVILQRRR